MSDHHDAGDTPLYGDGPGAGSPLGLPELLGRLGAQLGAAATTVCSIGDLLAAETARTEPQPEPVRPTHGLDSALDLTEYDHLAVNTVKDDPYGMDSDLAPAPQTWEWSR